MNCVIQCLIHSPLFRTFLQRDNFLRFVDKTRKEGCNGKLALEMSNLAKTKSNKDIRPAELKKIVNKYMSLFAGNE